jgi:hypothetical protein
MSVQFSIEHQVAIRHRVEASGQVLAVNAGSTKLASSGC